MKIKIELIPTVDEARFDQISGKTVIVIDVLRATSTIITALMHGCNEIYPVETSGQAFTLKKENALLVGERYCEKIEGFDYSNSPTELINIDLNGKNIILSTTNGTNAIRKATKAKHIMIGSFLNGCAVAAEAIKHNNDITFLCAGTRNQFALEDALCSGYIISNLPLTRHIVCSDYAWMAYAAYQHVKDDFCNLLPLTTTGNRLFQLGLTSDLQFCAQRDITSLVPYFKDDRIFVHPLS